MTVAALLTVLFLHRCVLILLYIFWGRVTFLFRDYLWITIKSNFVFLNVVKCQNVKMNTNVRNKKVFLIKASFKLYWRNMFLFLEKRENRGGDWCNKCVSFSPFLSVFLGWSQRWWWWWWWCYSYRVCAVCSQMDVISLFPMEILYYFTGVNSLLRFPRLLKVGMCFMFMHMFVLLCWVYHWLLSLPLSTWFSLSSTTEWKLWWRKRTSTGEVDNSWTQTKPTTNRGRSFSHVCQSRSVWRHLERKKREIHFYHERWLETERIKASWAFKCDSRQGEIDITAS